jgi:predicted component of type VI protein secretion system
MAYLIFSTDGQEWDRRELSRPTVLGRSADCDISVHDILLSRRHCRFTPIDGQWLLIDLASRNGTRVANQPVEQHRLKTGDKIHVGKSCLTFIDDAFIPTARPARPVKPPALSRPEDSLAGTVFAMEYQPQHSPSPARRPALPRPCPRPRDPQAFESEDLYAMIEQIASSSWDSIYAVNARPLRQGHSTPRPMIAGSPHPRPPRPAISFHLQASVSDCPVTPTRLRPKHRERPTTRLTRLTRWISRMGMIRLF